MVTKAITQRSCVRTESRVRGSSFKQTWWMQHREATLSWLALGMLLAAWNATEEDTPRVQRRPETLRGYAYVSVRAHQYQDQRR